MRRMPIRAHLFLMLICTVLLAYSGCATPTPPAPPAAPAAPSSVQAGDTTVVAVASPAAKCCPKQTLWQFLGVDKIFKGIGGLFNRLRFRLASRFPGLEPPPPLTSLTDPANLAEDASPAQQEAAKAKAEKDKAGQKVKGINYLATIGCTVCQPSIEKALIDAMEDCYSVEVRLAAVRALRANSGNPCVACDGTSRCCSPKIRKALEKLAYDRHPNGCYKEVSAVVRREARVAIRNCGGRQAATTPPPVREGPTPTDVEQDKPGEGPSAAEQAGNRTNKRGVNRSVLKKNQPTLASAEAVSSVNKTVVSAQPKKLVVEEQRLKRLPRYSPTENRASSKNQAVLAWVNGEPIYEHSVIGEVKKHVNLEHLASTPELMKLRTALIRQELQRQIDEKLVVQKMQQQKNPIQQVGYIEDVQPSKAEMTENWLAENATINRLVSQREIQQFYQQNQTRYRGEGSVRWELMSASRDNYSAKTTTKASSARDVLEYLRAVSKKTPAVKPKNANFKDLEVMRFDWSRLDEIRSDAIAKMLFDLEKGEISGIIEDDFGWHVLRVLDFKPGALKPLAHVQGDIKQEILRNRRLQQEQELLKQLRATANIKFTQAELQPKANTTANAAPNRINHLDQPTRNSNTNIYPVSREPNRISHSLRPVKKITDQAYPGSNYFNQK